VEIAPTPAKNKRRAKMNNPAENKVIIPEIVESNYDKAINLALETKADLPTIEKFMDLRERWEKNEARKAYNEAMTKFKANPPEIEKDKKVSYGNTKYNHASLANVTAKINSELSKYGLSASWTTAQSEKGVTVTCKISHVLGHSEETSLTAGLDKSGAKNDIQALGSTISYLERYTILALTGLATSEMDDDGQGTATFISDKQKSTIIDFIQSKEVDEVKFCAFMGVEEVGKILETDYNKAISALKSAKGKK
jgi:hypothetical protein